MMLHVQYAAEVTLHFLFFQNFFLKMFLYIIIFEYYATNNGTSMLYNVTQCDHRQHQSLPVGDVGSWSSFA